MDGRRIALSLLRIIPVSIAVGAIGWWVSKDPTWEWPGNALYKVKLLGGGMAASVLFYIAAMWLLRSEELQFLWGMVRKKARP
jgi:hypothetical protein